MNWPYTANTAIDWQYTTLQYIDKIYSNTLAIHGNTLAIFWQYIGNILAIDRNRLAIEGNRLAISLNIVEYFLTIFFISLCGTMGLEDKCALKSNRKIKNIFFHFPPIFGILGGKMSNFLKIVYLKDGWIFFFQINFKN